MMSSRDDWRKTGHMRVRFAHEGCHTIIYKNGEGHDYCICHYIVIAD